MTGPALGADRTLLRDLQVSVAVGRARWGQHQGRVTGVCRCANCHQMFAYEHTIGQAGYRLPVSQCHCYDQEAV